MRKLPPYLAEPLERRLLLTAFTNSTAINIPTTNTPVSLYPSTINVSGLSGSVTKITVTLNNISHTFPDDFGMALVGPTGTFIDFWSDAGGGTDLVGVTVTFDDAAASRIVDAGPLASGTFQPTGIASTADTFPAPGPGAIAAGDLAGPTGTATFANTFNGINPNGNWSLYVIDDSLGDGGSIAGGWTIDVTTNVAAAATTTTLASNLNPSFTSAPNNVVTFTATVTTTTGGTPVTTGTVTFKEGATVLGGGPVALNASGQAALNISTLIEGNHLINAEYNGTASFAFSVSNNVDQRVDNHTVIVGNNFANPGAIAIGTGAGGPVSPYPSNVFVSGLSGSISKVTLTLNNISHTFPDDLGLALVGPTGAIFQVMADVGGGLGVSGVTLTLDDAAASALPDGGTLASGTFRPTAVVSTADTFPAPGPGTPVAGDTAAPFGTATFANTFNNTSPNGTWKLFVIDDSLGNGGSIGGGWSLTFTLNTPPVVDLNGGGAGNDVSISFTEQTPVLIAPAGTVTEPNGDPVLSMGATLVARPDGNGVESLALNTAAGLAATGAGIVVNYNSGTGLLSLTGSASASTYQTILQGIEYRNTSNHPTVSNRSVTVVASDAGASVVRTSTISVARVNDVPTLDPISDVGVNQNTGPHLVGLSGITSGGEPQTLTVGATSNNPAVVPNPSITYTSPGTTGSLSFTPVPGATGSAVITVTVTDDATAGGPALNATRQFTITVNDAVGPVVTDVFVSSTAWNTAYKNSLVTNGTGEAAFGYRIVASEQTRTMAWSNLNQVSVRFNEAVVVAQNDVVVNGVNVASYGVNAFAYDAATRTATWTLSTPIGNDKITLDLDADAGTGVTDALGNRLDGEWTNPVSPGFSGDTFPSGNGTPGGDFVFNLRVLPGDIDRNGAVNVFDFNVLRPNLNVTGAGVLGGDINGDNVVNIFDFNDFKTFLGRTTPA